MAVVPDSELTKYNAKVKGKTIVVTGAGSGIGRATAKLFASYGAKVIVADMNQLRAEQTVVEIQELGVGEAVSCQCDVTIWEDLVGMFDHAIEKFGSVDVVVANAGVGEGNSGMVLDSIEGFPAKPRSTTVDISLTGVLYTVHLAQHYLLLNRGPQDSVKSIVLLGSIYSWAASNNGPLYTASKYAVLGLMRSVDETLSEQGISISCIHPFFAELSETALLSSETRLFLAGLPFAPVPRIAKTIFYAASHATHENPSGGKSFWVPDGDTPTFMIPREEYKPGVYRLIDTKSNDTSIALSRPRYYARLIGDLTPWLWRPLAVASAGMLLIGLSLYRRARNYS
ncbi:hypothetical protein GYMLUDRAFT_247416 [Collybiopsis luxurians FD-317 M1]|uniref:Unplaced genomic scaffold GYMLUscaffold_46, whole genome shotgun sequence n=1 Tax=Collybiopsis luxurians FD-317 M1 TaxID=944289 RepID=A0A0D0CNL9_9AGAR|nr:hypothetical protein GYMLUDRAFT_247416 [Collybiopsis luxurians FD-317 M1]